AVLLSQLGIKTQLVTVLPDNELGKAVLRYFRGFGINMDCVIVKNDSRLGLYFYEKGVDLRPPRLIYDRAHSALASLQKDEIKWDEVLHDCGWFHTTGITLSLSHILTEETVKAYDAVKRNNGIVSFDINYRSTLWKNISHAKTVMREFVKKVDVLIGNEDHIKKLLLPEYITNYNDIIDYLFTEYSNVKLILITHRFTTNASETEIGALASTRQALTELKVRKLKDVVDRIGSGDAMAAAFIYSFIKGNDLNYCVDFALAAGALAHTVDGDNFIVNESDIITVMENKSWQLIR
ncbi:MAG: sugar kinase, partial [Spirochaetota bacterium]